MSPSPNNLSPASGTIVELEQSLLWQIRAATDDLGRMDAMDEEQRAEIHAILEAIRHDREGRLLSGAGRYVPVPPRTGPESARLQEHFHNMLRAIQAAAEEYDRLALAAAQDQQRQYFQRLAREERRHLELAERLLQIVNE